jgi:SAM-dependent methyltransferase
MSHENITRFVAEFERSLQDETFVKLTLGNYKGSDAHLQKILVRLVEVKRGARLFFLYRYDTRDTAKNYDFAEGAKLVERLLGNEFFAAHLFTVENDFQLDVGKKNSRLNVGKPTFKNRPAAEHNREKNLLVNPNSFYLQALGITNDKGDVRDKQHDKYKQINKFVETVGNLFDDSELKDKNEISIVDMGSGKGYLTFAVYDYFNNVRRIKAKVTGVEARENLVALCNDIARSADFKDLYFIKGYINDFALENADILIALHACNTATDDAIYQGIKADSALIICAPCCHQEIRPQIKPPAMLKNVLKHGSLLEREAETLTDGLRSLLLEKEGYATKVFEFISTEHTPKNNLIVGIRKVGKGNKETIAAQISELKSFYGITEQRLEKLLDRANPADVATTNEARYRP